MNAVAIQPYALLDDQECEQRIRRARQVLGERLVILGHHYQRDEVFQHADFTGDSLKLSRQAAGTKAEYIVFCGVHFMAEVADILTRTDQVSILPDLAAGCSMADMADLQHVEKAWKELGEVLDPDEHVTPVTYINSAADLKAFCGDQHLGRNTGYTMGIPLEQMVVWDYDKPMGGLTAEQIRQAKIILWKGFCSVHQMFQPEQIDNFKQKYPETIVIAHPESPFEVCRKADFVGSTEYIIKTIAEGKPGSRWLVATELNMVNRLHDQHKAEGTNVHFMSPNVCMCSTMFRIDPQHLTWVLENLVDGVAVNQVSVPENTAELARLALNRMLEVSP
jgi:quinolinate synthase